MTDNGDRKTTITLSVRIWRRLVDLKNGPEDTMEQVINKLLDEKEGRD